MQFGDLIPWSRGRKGLGQQQRDGENPLLKLQRDINRVFDDLWARFDLPLGSTEGTISAARVRTDISETDKEVEVSVELPGVDENDVEVSLTDNALTIRGEKKSEREQETKRYRLSERSYGSFYRSVALPPGVDTDKAEARFKKGVLTVTLPKTADAQAKVRKVEVKAA